MSTATANAKAENGNSKKYQKLNKAGKTSPGSNSKAFPVHRKSNVNRNISIRFLSCFFQNKINSQPHNCFLRS
jgi:hypothetical protein